MKIRAPLVVLLLATSFLAALSRTGAGLAQAAERRAGLEVVGHRGGAGLAPENTLAAFAGAFALDVDGVEMDAHPSADGVVMIHHDPRLKPETTRGADGRWLEGEGPPIRTLSLKELKTYDVGRLKAGTKYAGRYPSQKPADGERIPTLAEVIALAAEKGDDDVVFWIEIKTSPLKPDLTPPPEDVAEAVIGVVREAGVAGRTLLLSFDWRGLVHAQKVAPEIPTVYLSARWPRFDTVELGKPGASPWTAGIDLDDLDGSIPRAVKKAGGRYWAPNHRQVAADEVAEAHALGLKVAVWTVNETADIERMIGLGADAIISDRPDRLKEMTR